MKRLVGVLVTIIVLYSIYYDLNQGTLPVVTTEQTTVAKSNSENGQPYFEKKVGVGDTVLSILEDHLNQSVLVPISDVVSDFQELNKGTPPQEIQPGNTYKFPDYQNEQ
ncbi:hypothetical protein JMM81_01575 [Bacillus sp. V3B]|uniref:hypothetical protein n=1 Tax=Bacillus sp. V3B TaxID=2804915 RepID=UPI002109CED6|nr:hypothetical protein [Bacillus sp. V3B]MCQ6273665.1 hypothetical protein [Bacillus sp. V3B]